MQPFSIKEAIGFGWRKTKEHFWFVVGVTFVGQVIQGLSRVFGDDRIQNVGAHDLILSLAFWILGIIVAIGTIKIFLALSRGEQTRFSEMFTHYALIWKFFLVSLVYGLIVLGGLILLVIPGFIFMAKYSLAIYLVVDKKMKTTEAIKESARLTKGNIWNIILFWLASAGVVILGLIALGVGIFVAIPIVFFAYTFVYEKLLNAGMSKSAAPIVAVEVK